MSLFSFGSCFGSGEVVRGQGGMGKGGVVWKVWMCYGDEEERRGKSQALGRRGPYEHGVPAEKNMNGREKESKERAANKNHTLTKPKRVH